MIGNKHLILKLDPIHKNNGLVILYLFKIDYLLY